MKIKQIIIILFIVLSVIPMTLMGVANMILYDSKLEKVMENDLRNTATIQMKAIDNFLEERRVDAQTIVRNPLIYQILGTESQTEGISMENAVMLINEILALRVRNNQYVESATILDPDFVVAACSTFSAVGEVSTLRDIDPQYLTPELLFTPVIETQRGGNRSRIIAAVMEIYDGDRMAGYLVMELNLTFFEEIRDSGKVYNNGTIYIIDGKEALITAGDTVSVRESFVLTEAERADYHRAWEERNPDSKSGILHYSARGNHYITFYAQFEDIDWTILSSVNIDELLQTQRGYLNLAIRIVAVLVCLLIAVNFIIRRYLGRPIGEMIKKFEQIEQTKDYSVRMKNTGSNEISTISASINCLLEGMEKYVQKERRINAELKIRAERDPLTGLYNKAAFDRLLDRELKKARESGKPLACMFLDIDDFKDFNTDHGHAGGDKVLTFIAEALRSQIGELACRQGGDEFTVCIPDASDVTQVECMIHDLLSSLQHGLRLDEKGRLVSVNCSIGIAFSDEKIYTAAELLKKADEAMYEVKKEEKNGFRIWLQKSKTDLQ